jgi:bifunctional DNA-binding transcriptional regulator/antitoxin component of YhaV-PrlF toxin-antitoxin module
MEASMTMTVRVGEDLALPADALEAAGLAAGDTVVVERTADGLVIRRATLGEEVDADIAAGRTRSFDSEEEFAAYLDSLPTREST